MRYPCPFVVSHVSLIRLSVTASADYSSETSYVNTESEKTIMTSSRYLFPQGRIDISAPGSGFSDDVQLSPEFTGAIDAALAKTSKTDQREALDAVFNEFGHVYRTSVQMGGTLSAHTMETFYRSVRGWSCAYPCG